MPHSTVIERNFALLFVLNCNLMTQPNVGPPIINLDRTICDAHMVLGYASVIHLQCNPSYSATPHRSAIGQVKRFL